VTLLQRFSLLIALFVMIPFSAQSDQSADPATENAPTPALLFIDIQVFYFPEGALPLAEPEAASRNAKLLLEKWRAEDRLVIHVGHNARNGADFHPDVAPLPGEKVVMKDEVNSFHGTDLLEYLQDNEVTELVICGMQTHMCLEAAVRAASDLGFSCQVVHDACATRDLEFAGATVAAQDVHLATLSTLAGVYAEVVDTQAALALE